MEVEWTRPEGFWVRLRAQWKYMFDYGPCPNCGVKQHSDFDHSVWGKGCQK